MVSACASTRVQRTDGLSVAQLLINGKFVDAAGGRTFETYDPRTGEVLMSVAEAQAEDVDKAVRAAREVASSLPLAT